MNLDLSLPAHLTTALAPDLFLFAGAMVLLLVAAWRPDSAGHQRGVGLASLGLAVAVLASVLLVGGRGMTAGNGVIAVDAFRWSSDVVFLVAATITIALSIGYNGRQGIHSGEAHVLLLLATAHPVVISGTYRVSSPFLPSRLLAAIVGICHEPSALKTPAPSAT